MAIVKFVSDKECQIFIDKECVGEVTTDSMLKVTLESGEYLIEAKDRDAHILKKYNLEIKQTDNNLLQDVSGEVDSIDEVINQLRNDSSLEFHCDRALFSHNGKYGYINKKFEVVIPAIYSVANNFNEDKAFVVRDFPEGRKTTLIDSDGNMFFNRWYDYIGESESAILLGIENRIVVYSKIQFDKAAEYYNAGYDFKHPYVPVFRKDGIDELYGIIDFDGKEVVPLIYDKVWNFDNNGIAKVFFWGNYDEIEISTFTLNRHKELNDVKFRNAKSFEDLIAYLWPFSEYRYLSNNHLDYTIEPERRDGRWKICVYSHDIRNIDDVTKTEIECEKILYIGKGCFAYRKGFTSIVKFLESNEEYSFKYDYIVPINKITGGYISSCYYAPDKFLIRTNGKYGLINKNGEEEMPVIYDSFYVIYPEFNENTSPQVYAIIQNGNSYAIANISKGTLLVPFEYENIICLPNKSMYSSDIFLLYKKGKYSLYSGNKEQEVSDTFDDFIMGNTHIVRIANKYGVVDSMGNQIVQVKNDYIYPIGRNNYIVEDKDTYTYAFGNFEMEELNYFDYGTEISILYSDKNDDIFLIELNGKYGCMNCYGELLTYIIHDKIEVVSKESRSPATYIIRTIKDGVENNLKIVLYSWQRSKNAE